MTRQVLELKGFQRVAAAPGQTRTVTFELPAGLLGFHGRDMAYVVEPGEIEVRVELSSDRLAGAGRFTITDDGTGRAPAKALCAPVSVR